MGFTGELAVLAEGVAFLPSFANVTAFETGEGLVLVDTGGFLLADHVHTQLRAWTDQPLHTAIFTHGHVDHVFGVAPFEAEAAERGRPAPRVVAHANVPRRFARYALTAGYNGVINARQFGLPELAFPAEFRHAGRAVRRRAGAGGRRRALRAAPRQGRDRRPHVGLGAGPQDPLLRRPVHLGHAQRRQPPEGAAPPARMGAGAAADGRSSARR